VALAPPIDSLSDNNDLPALDVVDFNSFNEIVVFGPSFKTRHETIATWSVSLHPMQPLHVDKFSDGFSNPCTVSGAS
jgi:hypothetical protein